MSTAMYLQSNPSSNLCVRRTRKTFITGGGRWCLSSSCFLGIKGPIITTDFLKNKCLISRPLLDRTGHSGSRSHRFSETKIKQPRVCSRVLKVTAGPDVHLINYLWRRFEGVKVSVSSVLPRWNCVRLWKCSLSVSLRLFVTSAAATVSVSSVSLKPQRKTASDMSTPPIKDWSLSDLCELRCSCLSLMGLTWTLTYEAASLHVQQVTLKIAAA